ncbi:hypothetical protein F5146DRAFT_1133928 [Armillaria mellea]|nr:hypothetical protein F5146DRAFT_1133928 [Armillaria mellea]
MAGGTRPSYSTLTKCSIPAAYLIDIQSRFWQFSLGVFSWIAVQGMTITITISARHHWKGGYVSERLKGAGWPKDVPSEMSGNAKD